MDREKVKVSVIIPCYNSEDFVSRAIESVINQSVDSWELILVNNNSTDNTKSILEKYRDKYPDKIQVVSESKKGAPAARNRGLSLASGSWVQFLDADDELPGDKFERQLHLAELADADLVAGEYVKVLYFHKKIIKNLVTPLTSLDYALVRMKLGITSSNLWRRESVLNVSGWDEHLSSAQEYHLILKMIESGAKITFDIGKSPVLIHCIDNSISRNPDPEKNVRQFEEFLNFKRNVINYLQRKSRLTSKLKKESDYEIYSCSLYKKAFLTPELKECVNCLDISFPRKLKANSIYNVKRIIKAIL